MLSGTYVAIVLVDQHRLRYNTFTMLFTCLLFPFELTIFLAFHVAAILIQLWSSLFHHRLPLFRFSSEIQLSQFSYNWNALGYICVTVGLGWKMFLCQASAIVSPAIPVSVVGSLIRYTAYECL